MAQIQLAFRNHKLRKCSSLFWLKYTRPKSQPNLLCGNTEAVTWSCA